MKTFFIKTLKSALVAACVALLADCKKEQETLPSPKALFSFSPTTNLVAPVTIQFINQSTNAESYVWDFGGTLTDKDIALVFNEAGTYTISLKATGKGGADTYTKVITVAAPTSSTKPFADFTYSPSQNNVAPATITFTNTSTNASTYKWDFGDNTTASTASPTKQFSKDGTYTVKLTATGAGGSAEASKNITIGKANTAPAVGKAMFWASGSWNHVNVTTEQVTYMAADGSTLIDLGGGFINKAYASAPACSGNGYNDTYITQRPVGTYTFKAIAYKTTGEQSTDKVAEVTGSYTVVANTCTPIKLDFSAATTTGQAIFYTDKSSGWSSIDVTVGGSSAGSITGYFTSAPSCGASKAVTVTRSPGKYAYTAQSNTGVKWTGDVTVTANQCQPVQLNFPAGSDCDWATWNKYIKVTKYEYDPSGSYCGKNTGITYLEIQNLSTIDLSIYFCMKNPDGTWYCAFVDTGAGQLMKTNHCTNSQELKTAARPFGKSSSCPFPNP